jgi:hypothetical protein
MNRRGFIGAAIALTAGSQLPTGPFWQDGTIPNWKGTIDLGENRSCTFCLDWFRAAAMEGDTTGIAQMRCKVDEGEWEVVRGTFYPDENRLEFPSILGGLTITTG